MIGFLLRRDPLRFAVPAFWVLGIVFGVVMARAANEDFLAGYGPHTQHADKPFFEWAMVNAIMICGCTFGSMQAWRVATPFQRSLPLDARALFWSRMLTTLAAMLGGSLLSCAAFAVQYEHPLHPLQVSLAVSAQALIVLVPLLFHCARLERAKGLPWFLFAPLLVAVVWLGTRLGMRSFWPATFWISLALALAVWIQRRLPRGFELAHSHGAGRFGAGFAALEDGLRGLPGVGRSVTLDRCLRQPRVLTRGQLLLVLSITMLLGVLVLTRSGWGGVLALTLVQMAWFARCVGGSGRVAHLPIPRDRVFRHAVIPGLSLLAATAVADLAGWWQPDPTWPGLLVLWAFTWWQLLSLAVAPSSRPFAEHPGRLIAAGSFLLLVSGVALIDEPRSAIADWVARQSPDLLWLIAAAAWVGAVLALRAAFLRADCTPTPQEALT